MTPSVAAAILTAGVLMAPFASVGSVAAEGLRLTAPGITDGGTLPLAQVYNQNGCTGGNLSPAMSWTAPPAGTKAFAVTLFDKTARDGQGFWHWGLFDIPASARALKLNATYRQELPDGTKIGRNDFGYHGFSGACPPKGSGKHQYVLTVWAVPVSILTFPSGTEDATVGAWLKAHAIGKAEVTASYSR